MSDDANATIEKLPTIKVLYRDGHYLAAHKPIDMATYQESRGQGALGLKEILEEQLVERLFPVHRIDADTSGVVMFALNSKSAAALVNEFKRQQVSKLYSAWCVGDMKGQGSITTPLRKHKSELKESARTDFKRTQLSGGYSLVTVLPHTGRFHQIRRHFASIGHPIVGDPKYGPTEGWASFFKANEKPRLMLQAESVEFMHPVTRKPVRVQTKIKL